MNIKSKAVLIPCIVSISFVLSYWVSSTKQGEMMLGLSADGFSGVITGLGIGLMLALLISFKRQQTRS